MKRDQILKSIAQGDLNHKGSVREPNNRKQLDKYEDSQGNFYLTEKPYPSFAESEIKLFKLIPMP